MPVFKPYGEAYVNFPRLPELRMHFNLMSNHEQGFCNQVRHYYHIAYQATAGDNRECGSNVFFGGHVVMEDGGAHYDNWCAQLNARELRGGKRWSSHYKTVNTQQYEIILPKLGCILFGKTQQGHTWFQNESWQASESGVAGWGKWVAHGVLGYGFHKLSRGKQVGGLGYSNWSETNPLVIPALHAPV